MNREYRKENFKLEQIHGRTPSESSIEARIRNYLFSVKLLVINYTNVDTDTIRIVGYEVPIYSRGNKRDECIDLLGYDSNYHPWLIELKASTSNEKIADIVTQLNRYMNAFEEGIREPVQNEIRERLLWPSFSFQGDARMMILAERSFFSRRSKDLRSNSDCTFCSFSKCTNETTMLESPRANVRLKIM